MFTQIYNALCSVAGFLGTPFRALAGSKPKNPYDNYLQVVSDKYGQDFVDKVISHLDELNTQYGGITGASYSIKLYETVIDMLLNNDFIIQDLRKLSISDDAIINFIVKEGSNQSKAQMRGKQCFYEGEEQRYLDFILKNAKAPEKEILKVLKQAAYDYDGEDSRDESPTRGAIQKYIDSKL